MREPARFGWWSSFRRGFGVVIFGLLVTAENAPYAFAQGNASVPLSPQVQRWEARASQIDPRVTADESIQFLLEKEGKPQDLQQAIFDPMAPQIQGKLVIWMMGRSPELFDRLASYGFHALRVHYANGWFSRFSKEVPPGDTEFLGRIRLEAATGEDFSEVVEIAGPDGMMERVRQFLIWLHQQAPESGWGQYLTEDRSAVRWDRVVMAGASHGATTSARFAKHQQVARVVMFCGPRDQFETWQGLPSATPLECYFGFTHTLDDGWSGDHYCRSWELLGLQRLGPLVDVDRNPPPYQSTRRLITSADVKGDAKRAHSCVVPGGSALRKEDGSWMHEPVWRYLFLHPVEEVGRESPMDPDCNHAQ